MDDKGDISEDLSRRIDMLAPRSTLTRGQIIEDALSHGRSPAWQEKWIAGVQAGNRIRLTEANSPRMMRLRRS